jgi:serine/threonine protein kinase
MSSYNQTGEKCLHLIDCFSFFFYFVVLFLDYFPFKAPTLFFPVMASSRPPAAAHLQKTLGTPFEIDPVRYELLKSLGKGAFGIVWYGTHVFMYRFGYFLDCLLPPPIATYSAAHDHATNDVVAVKKILHVFDNTTSAKRVLREIKLMRHLRHPNLTGIRDLPIASPLLHAYE